MKTPKQTKKASKTERLVTSIYLGQLKDPDGAKRHRFCDVVHTGKQVILNRKDFLDPDKQGDPRIDDELTKESLRKERKAREAGKDPRAKYAPPNAETMADVFQFYAKIVRGIVNTYAEHQDDPELGRLYTTYKQAIRTWTILHKGVKNCPDPKDMPTLESKQYSVYVAAQALIEFCEKVPVKRAYKRWPDYLPEAEKIVTDGRFENMATLQRQLRISKGTAQEIRKHSAIVSQAAKANKLHPKTHKVESLSKQNPGTRQWHDIETEAPEEPPSLTEANDALSELLEGLAKENHPQLESTKREIDGMNDDGKRALAQALKEHPDISKRPKSLRKDAYKTQKQVQYKQL